MVKIGNVEICGPLTLAPMAGVTDAPFRALCRAQGAALTCTEMVSAKALVYLFVIWEEKVLRLCSILCSSPISA